MFILYSIGVASIVTKQCLMLLVLSRRGGGASYGARGQQSTADGHADCTSHAAHARLTATGKGTFISATSFDLIINPI